ncbi:hypothetical protein B9479_003988 [Cryptococcus floricola]|uniref:Uncharacterized protein n=1 Tax=Cryptococcus floricola TaxID=2591691 RepID=A0A5D3AZ54_9TREE|nr:hypothetical protein B9479_003988 [Cryptococcus floricola]
MSFVVLFASSSRASLASGLKPAHGVQSRAFQHAFHACSRRAAAQLAIAALPSPPSVPLTSPWPWRPVSPSTKKANPHTIIEERVIYARPMAFSPRKYLAMGFSLGALGMVFASIPDKPIFPDWWTVEEDIGIIGRAFGTFNNYLLMDAPPYLCLLVTAVVAWRVFVLSGRRVTRLSQIRVRSDGADSQPSKTYLQLYTGRQAFWGRLAKPRELDLEQVNVETVPGKHGKGFLSMTLDPKARKLVIIERKPYFLDFTNSSFLAGTNQEVVVSVNRIEHLFGKLPTPASSA